MVVPYRRVAALCAPSLFVLTLTASACVTRPVTNETPSEKASFTTLVRTAAIDKVDLLFAIDNSASMGDKQSLLREAIPDLIDRLVRPACVTEQGAPAGTFDPKGGCPNGSEPEIPPIRDLHVGIVDSSLGGFGTTACNDKPHGDDKGHLVARTPAGQPAIAQAQPGGFLAYLPQVPQNAGKPNDPNLVGAIPYEDPKAFVEAFQQLVVGVGEDGCGYEAQLESAYRFLIQPDPYESATLANDHIRLDGVDAEVLKARAKFLRPDSLVAVVVVTDENESTIDPNAFGGNGWRFLKQDKLPPGTTACDTSPDDASCTSCMVPNNDPRCTSMPVRPDDDPNVRFWDMKRRFGLDPRYGIDRYVRGLTEKTVPDRSGNVSHLCTNPLFANRLPQPGENLCNLPRGPRTEREVLFTVIGGVPWQLLTEKPENLRADNSAPFKTRLEPSDWVKLLGEKSTSRHYVGAHPLLQESTEPRAGVDRDGAHDREWNTLGKDLQYACTFELPVPKDCSKGHDPGCDCDRDTDSPLCNPQNPRQQTRGKGYPGLTALSVARDLGDRAVVASICPREVHDKASPVYGYRPAMGALLDRIGDVVSACVPELHPDTDGKVPCLVLEAQPEGVTACDATRGRRPADTTTVTRLRQESEGVLEGRTVCEVDQLGTAARSGGPCGDSPTAGFCYVTGKEAGKHCSQGVRFSKTGAQLPGATVYLQCIDEQKAEAR